LQLQVKNAHPKVSHTISIEISMTFSLDEYKHFKVLYQGGCGSCGA